MAKSLLGRRFLVVSAVLVVIAVGYAFGRWYFTARRLKNLPSAIPAAPSKAAPRPTEAPPAAILAQRLEIPWALDFLPGRTIVFTERPGRVRLLDPKRGLQKEPLLTIDEVAAVGEGGLLGVAVHPHFIKNHLLYVYYTYRSQGRLANKVVRYRMAGKALADPKTVITDIPAATIHDGGRIKFGPDGLLYITTGDSGQSQLAQDKTSLAGKILRVTDEGKVPHDNPFPNSPVYSLGHRNPEGLAWDGRGKLWETEHGETATDEVNLIEPGRNYGWPIIRGNQKAFGFQSPVIQSGEETWAPSGATFWDGSLFFTGLRSQTLFELVASDSQVALKRHLQGRFGRLREVVVGPDQLLYLLTSNRDGRGFPTSEDDQMIRINPRKL